MRESGMLVRAWRKRLRALRNVPPLAHIVWQSGPGVVTGGLACRVASALIPLAMLAVSKRILDAVQAHFGGHPLPPVFWYLVGAEAALAALGAFLGRLTGYFDSLLADRFTRFVSVKVMEHASRLDLASYEDPVFYDKLERARVQATDRVSMIQALGAALQQVVAAASLAAGVLWFSPWLLVLLVAAVVPAFLGESHFAFAGYEQNIRQTPVRRQLDYLRTLGASKESAKELKLFDLGGFLSAEYTRLSNGIYEQNVRLAGRRLRAGALLSLISTGGYYGAYAYVIYRTVTGDLTWGSLQFLAGAIAGASTNIQSIFSTLSSIADQSLFLTDLVEFLRVGPTIQSKPGALPAPRPIRDGFVFERVSFSYPGSGRRVLDRLNLQIGREERIALIGENGQGKTTIVKLLTRLYDPTEGRILLDGTDLREYHIEDLHREIGVIFQDFVRYEMTARQNIATGRMGASEAEIVEASRKSLADQVVGRLPDGLDQLLGRRFEGGLDLSGGEWQRMALARAYLRDAQILILDEPTASLDARSEYEVFQRFAELTQDKMALLISHRFSTVRMADRILVLEDGRIAEQGSHGSLLALGGRYASMFELQASSYR
ncbi:MAG TPA: ABC transporter ATP-binding protein [Candidatus Acidoferrales bacterium]|nr:ABC transporter ATP-binding protein [Candidatus Acidoferrales bacterium]